MIMEKEIVCGIYGIINIKNNKIYIGSSKNIYSRWQQHKNTLKRNKHHSQHLQLSWNKYGEENFIFEIIEKCSEENLLIKEQYYIDLYSSYDGDYGYNISEFAGKPSMTDEQRINNAKITSEKFKGEGSWCNIYKEDQIIKLIEDLKTGKYSYKQLSKKHNITYDNVVAIVYHNTWEYLTKDIEFPTPMKSSRDNVKLNEDEVKEIIQLMLNGECNEKISEMYNVAPHTISDIRNHKTWKEFTKDIDFIKSPKSKAKRYNNKELLDKIFKLRNEKFTYKQISEKLNISQSWIYTLIKKNK